MVMVLDSRSSSLRMGRYIGLFTMCPMGTTYYCAHLQLEKQETSASFTIKKFWLWSVACTFMYW